MKDEESSTLAPDTFYTPANAEFYSREVYTPLNPPSDRIRLLRLLPESEDGIFRCEVIESCHLDSKNPHGSYSALSYAAGDQEKTTTILVNGVPFNAFANLARALEEARSYLLEFGKDLSHSYIWADQVCINQSDPSERSAQVAVMDRIYSCAEAVLICLPAAGQICRGVELACFLSSGERACTLHSSKAVASHHPWLATVDRWTAEDHVDTWRSLLDLFRSPWWSRAWICQEFILAPRAFFVGGNHAITWEQLHGVLESLFVQEQEKEEFYGRVSDFRPQAPRKTREFLDFVRAEMRRVGGKPSSPQLAAEAGKLDLSPLIPRYMAGLGSSKKISQLMDMKAGKRRFPLPDLLHYGRQCQTSDPRDKVFAFLGLADFRYTIQPDYTIPFDKVLVDAAARMFEYIPGIVLQNALSNGRPSVSRLGRLPSWVPTWFEDRKERWDTPEALVPYTIQGPTPEPRFTYARADFHGQLYHVLRLWGFRIGTVNADGTLNSFFSKKQPIYPRNPFVRENDELWTICIAPDEAQDFIVRRSDRYYLLVSEVYWRPPGSVFGETGSGCVNIRQIGTGPGSRYIYQHTHPRFSFSRKSRNCECLEMEAIELA